VRGEPASEEVVEVHDVDFAADVFANEWVAEVVGGVTFVEVRDVDEWVIWRVEELEAPPGMRAFQTGRVSEEEMRREMASSSDEM
jgi:hypothetical protein